MEPPNCVVPSPGWSDDRLPRTDHILLSRRPNGSWRHPHTEPGATFRRCRRTCDPTIGDTHAIACQACDARWHRWRALSGRGDAERRPRCAPSSSRANASRLWRLRLRATPALECRQPERTQLPAVAVVAALRTLHEPAVVRPKSRLPGRPAPARPSGVAAIIAMGRKRQMAEGVGFEPTSELPHCRFSRPVP